MSVFSGAYAKYYDLFYADKDYAAEAAFISAIIRRYAPQARTILELGCGSGGHALQLIREGYAVTGVDQSSDMLAQAEVKSRKLSPGLRSQLVFRKGDVTRLEPGARFDAVLSLFHVASYQTTNDHLQGLFNVARMALMPGGVFVCDFWYGPAVLAQKPRRRIRRIETQSAHVTRIAEPEHNARSNIVRVKYLLAIEHKTEGKSHEVREVHAMRYLFLPEIDRMLSNAGLVRVEAAEWLSGRPLDQKSWSGYAAALSPK